MWLLCFGLFASTSAFPFGVGSPWGRNGVENYKMQLVEYGIPQICLPSLFRSRICIPSGPESFPPLQMSRELCFSMLGSYIVKICPSAADGGNSNKSLKEIIKEVGTEAEKERLRDNANIEVNGGEVKEERDDEFPESKLQGKSSEGGNTIVPAFDPQINIDSPNRVAHFDDLSIESNFV